MLKAAYLVKAIDTHKMDQAIVFCRTKLDCDHMEQYLLSLGGGWLFHSSGAFKILYRGGLGAKQLYLFLQVLFYFCGSAQSAKF